MKKCGRSLVTTTLSILPLPATPVISASPEGPVCGGTDYVNFSASPNPVPDSNYYLWTATGGTVFERGSTTVNVLVNFSDSLNTKIYLRDSSSATGCISIPYIKSYDLSPAGGFGNPRVYWSDAAQGYLCFSDFMDEGYQWGWDAVGTLDSGTIQGAVNQLFFCAGCNVDPTRYYWVMVSFGGCMQKIYDSTHMPLAASASHHTSGSGIRVFPNPTTGTFTVGFPQLVEAAFITVYDISGRAILGKTLDAPALLANVKLPAALPAGNYLLQVSTIDGVFRMLLTLE